MRNYFIQPPEFVSAFEITVDNASRPWTNPLHMHNDTEFFFIQDGQGEFMVNDSKFVVQKGDIIVHNPLMEHQEASTPMQPFRGVSVFCKGLHLGDRPKGFVTNPHDVPLFHLQEVYGTVNNLLSEVLNEYYAQKPGYVEINSSLLQTIIILLLRTINSANQTAVSSVTHKVKMYIEENFRVELTLSDLADIVYVSPYHLAHVFKQDLDVSPIQYLIKCRIEEAKKLLAHSDLSVSDISAAVGYPNANYFSILFKKVTGKNPGKFRTKGG